jgi:hypothetical protein
MAAVVVAPLAGVALVVSVAGVAGAAEEADGSSATFPIACPCAYGRAAALTAAATHPAINREIVRRLFTQPGKYPRGSRPSMVHPFFLCRHPRHRGVRFHRTFRTL